MRKGPGTARIALIAFFVAATLTMKCFAEGATPNAAPSGMKAVYPAPGETVDNGRPLIAVDLTGLATPVDKASVVVFFDGADVTGGADVTQSYVMYRPPSDLFGGSHKLKIQAKTASGAVIAPFELVFYVKGYYPGYKRADNTRGKFVISSDISRVRSKDDPSYKVADILQEKAGTKLNLDLDLTNVTAGRTVIANVHRETQAYTGIGIDKGYINYFDKNFEGNVGYFQVRLSDFTIAGAEMGGMKIDSPFGNWKFSLFAGRTQDPSTSGTYKQNTNGAQAQYTWGSRNKTSVTYLLAREDDNPLFRQSPGSDAPAQDSIFSFLQEYKRNDNLSATLELARNHRVLMGKTGVDDGAGKFSINLNKWFVSSELSLYDIGQNFVPVAEGNSKYMLSNRTGYRGKGSVHPGKWFSAGGEYEAYDSMDPDSATDKTTSRGNAFVALSNGSRERVQYTTSRLTTTTGVVSESQSVMTSLYAPRAAMFRGARVGATAQEVKYTDGKIFTDTKMVTVTAGIWYKGVWGINSSWNKSNVDILSLGRGTDSTKLAFGLDWKIKPNLLTLSSKYEDVNTTGSGVDNHETRFRNLMRYTASKEYSYTLGWDRIAYNNSVTPEFNYDQNIVRSGLEVNF